MTVRAALIVADARFARSALMTLRAAGLPIDVVIDATRRAVSPRRAIPVRLAGEPPNLAALAAVLGVATTAWADNGERAVVDLLAARDIDVLICACVPFRLSAALRDAARIDCVNLHPALLPRYRGPAPVFHQLRAGERDTGVSVHRVVEDWDAGPIYGSAAVALPCGSSGGALDRRLGARAAQLLMSLLPAMASGGCSPAPQNDADATWAPWPVAADGVIDRTWSARRAFDFLRGTAGGGLRHRLIVGEEHHEIVEAVGFDPAARLECLQPVDGDVLAIPFRPGVVWARAHRIDG